MKEFQNHLNNLARDGMEFNVYYQGNKIEVHSWDSSGFEIWEVFEVTT